MATVPLKRFQIIREVGYRSCDFTFFMCLMVSDKWPSSLLAGSEIEETVIEKKKGWCGRFRQTIVNNYLSDRITAVAIGIHCYSSAGRLIKKEFFFNICMTSLILFSP